MTPEDLRRDAEALSEALGREWYLAGAGLTTEPRFQAIYQRFAHLGSPEAGAAARAADSPALLEWAVDYRIGRVTADLDERQQRWEQGTELVLDDGTRLPYQRAPIELANTPARARRRSIEAARAARVSELAAICRDRFRREREILAEAVPDADAVRVRAALTGIDLDALAAAADRFLVETDDLYHEALAHPVKRRLGVPLGELARYDIAYLFRAEHLDAAFPPGRMLETARRQFGALGLDPACQGRVSFDADERPGKAPRAFVSPARVPEEVYLVLRPQGGHTDYRTFWHELGHAMHFGSVDPGRPYEHRWLGDNSVTEGYAMLYDHLTLDPGWLARFAGLSHDDAQGLAREALTEELFLVRRYAAKLGYECQLYRADPAADLGDEYADRLTRATSFRYAPGDALVDVDPGFYSARYLRAWQLEALLSGFLRERYDEDWYRNPAAGPVLLALFAGGQAEPADRIALQVCHAPLAFDAVRERLEARLA